MDHGVLLRRNIARFYKTSTGIPGLLAALSYGAVKSLVDRGSVVRFHPGKLSKTVGALSINGFLVWAPTLRRVFSIIINNSTDSHNSVTEGGGTRYMRYIVT